MKKRIFLCVALSLAFAFAAACASNKNESSGDKSESSSTAEVSSSESVGEESSSEESSENVSTESSSEESSATSSEESSASVSDESSESVSDEISSEESSAGGEVAEDCVVTFDSDGGSSIAPVTVKKGDKISAPEIPEKSSMDCEYEFLGWYYGGVAWDFENDTVEGDITLVAQWKATDKYTKPFLPKD